MENRLVIKVNSFSYKKSGIPIDDSGNGGGFVFDCRGILNPGRIEEYKKQTGLDQPVRDFLESQTQMPSFISHIQSIIEITVQDYLTRGFENLIISFGCTGGQHRSVYGADVVAMFLHNKYNIPVYVKHIEQGISKELIPN
jgi:RNase adaptor protein for sRNA GlmZ degradation